MDTNKEFEPKIQVLVTKASEAHDARDAMMFTQAALNAAQALNVLVDVKAKQD